LSARLAAGVWVSAYLTRLRLADIAAYVTAKGDAEAGAVVVKVALLDGSAKAYERRSDLMTGARAWILLAEGTEVEVDALLARARPGSLGDRAGRPAGAHSAGSGWAVGLSCAPDRRAG
jgi:hypothetical protein